MPPRRPPPLLPRARLIEAMNAVPIDDRKKPLAIFDSGVYVSDLGEDPAGLKISPWLTKSTNSKDEPVSATAAGIATVKSIDTGIPVKGCNYFIHEVVSAEKAAASMKSSQIRVDNATLTIRASPDSSKGSLASRVDSLRSLTQTGGISVLGVSRTVSRTDASNKQFLDIISWLAAEKYCLLLEAVKDTLTQDISHASIPVFLDQLVQEQKGSLPLKVVICSMGGADLGSVVRGRLEPIEEYERVFTELSLYPNVYWQYSGYMSRLPRDLVEKAMLDLSNGEASGQAYKSCKKALSAFFVPVLESFGEDRIIWASDWSSATQLSDDASLAWPFSFQLALDVACDIGLRGEALDKIFFGNAQRMQSSSDSSINV